MSCTITAAGVLWDGRTALSIASGGDEVLQLFVNLADPPAIHQAAELVVKRLPEFEQAEVQTRLQELARSVQNWTVPTHRGPIKLHSVADLLSMPPVRWLLKNVLPRSGLVFMFGQPGSGKSFLALDIALHVALDLPWCGRKVRHGPVLVLVGEGGSGLPQRVKAWRIGHRQILDAFPAEFAFEAPAIATPEGQHRMREAVDSMSPSPVLVIIDTLAQALPGADENAVSEVGPPLRFLAALAADRDLCVLVIHHERKSAHADGLNAMRGSSALAGAADAAVRVRRSEDRITAEVVKQKDGESDVSLDFRMERVGIGEDEDGEVRLVPYLRPVTEIERRAAQVDARATFLARFRSTFGGTGANAGELDAAATGWGLTRKESRSLRMEAVERRELILERAGVATRFHLADPPAFAGETASTGQHLADSPGPRTGRGGEISEGPAADPGSGERRGDDDAAEEVVEL